jgi:trimethylamine:corrinoid methyltransferase-like protein
MPIVSLRESYEVWLSGGRENLLERADEVVRTLLKEHEVVPLPEAVDREIDAILASAAKEKGIA